MFKAVHVDRDPLNYFLRDDQSSPFLQVSDVMLRRNKDPKEVFSHLIRMATNSQWSHSAIVYLTSDPALGFNNTFLVEAKTKGTLLTSWRNEVVPFEQFIVGIKRPKLDWYVENAYEKSRHHSHDPEDTHGISYLRHVRGIAIDQLNGLYDKKVVYELAALYTERVARRHLGAVPQVGDAAEAVADMFKKWDEKEATANSMLRFICSGLVQYSFFEALRRRIMNDMDVPEHREAALSNLRNFKCVLYRPDPEGVFDRYVEDVLAGKLDIHDPAPEDVLDLVKTATPADFNNSSALEWRYIVFKGHVWKIEDVGEEDYVPQNEEEAEVLKMLNPEHHE